MEVNAEKGQGVIGKGAKQGRKGDTGVGRLQEEVVLVMMMASSYPLF